MFPETMHVECVPLMSKFDVDKYIKVEIGEEELDEIEFSKNAIYKEI